MEHSNHLETSLQQFPASMQNQFTSYSWARH